MAFEPYPTSYINFYNLNTNKIEYTSKSPVARFSFTPDNSHLYSMSFEGFNYQKLYGEYLNYSGYGNTLESGGIQSNYYVFVGKLFKAKLYKNSTTGIIEQEINKSIFLIATIISQSKILIRQFL